MGYQRRVHGELQKIMVRAKASARKSPAAGSSKEAKINDQVEVYRKEMCAKAQALLESTIPNKLEFLCQLLQGEKWQSDYSVKAREFCIESIEQYEKDVEEARSGQNGQEENIEELDGGDIEEDEEAAEGPSSAKQIKLGENSSTLSIELKEKSQPSKQPKIEVNQINLELSNILKPELIALGKFVMLHNLCMASSRNIMFRHSLPNSSRLDSPAHTKTRRWQ